MKPFFNSIGRILALRFHAAELVDTPFVKNAMVPGGGIDCVHVNAWCYLKTGFFSEFTPPRYALDSGAHDKSSALLAWLDGDERFHRLPTFNAALNDIIAGDTACFNLGLSEHHTGLVLDLRRFIHVLPRRRVIISSLEESCYGRRLTAVYRPVET